MCSQFGQQTGTQTPKGVGMIDLQVELLSQLAVDGLDNLSNRIEGAADSLRRLVGLVTTGQGHQLEAIVPQQLAGQLRTDIAFVTKDGQISVFRQQFSANSQVSGMSRG